MPPDKYEDEIREILNKMDDFVPDGNERPKPIRRQSPPPWSGWTSQFRKNLYKYDSMSFMAAMVVLALVAGIFRQVYPPFASIAAALSLACLVMAIGLPMFSRHYDTTERRWRGNVIDYEPYRIRRTGGSSWQYFWYKVKKFFRIR